MVGIDCSVYSEVAEIIDADVNKPRIEELLTADRAALQMLIAKG